MNNYEKQRTEDSTIQKSACKILQHQDKYVNGKTKFQDDTFNDLEQSDEQNKNSEKCDEMTIHENIVPYHTDIV